MRELAPRALDGGISAEDLGRVQVRRADRRGYRGRRRLRESGASRLVARAPRAGRAQLAVDCSSAVADALLADVLDRLTREARRLRRHEPRRGGPHLRRRRRRLRLRRARAAPRPRSAASPSPTYPPRSRTRRPRRARARTESVHLRRRDLEDLRGGERAWANTPWRARWTTPLIGLRRKSERVRARVLEGAAGAGLDGRGLRAGRRRGGLLPVPRRRARTRRFRPRADAARRRWRRAREAWAASWGPGPLGAGACARGRGGGSTRGRLRFTRAPKAERLGPGLLARPRLGTAWRVLVEAAPGGIEGLLAGGAAADRWALGAALGAHAWSAGRPRRRRTAGRLLFRRSGLKSLARAGPGAPGRAARRRGRGGLFATTARKLYIHHARPLEAPAPCLVR